VSLDLKGIAFMHPDRLDLKELLEMGPDGGTIRFAGQRALLLDAVAMGLLRKYLVENFGRAAARVVLTQFGFAHGWRMAEAMQAEFNWPDDKTWREAGTRIHTLEGLFGVVPGRNDPQGPTGLALIACYEAEQHLLHFGRADEAVCWTVCGLISGYVSKTAGKKIYVLEDRCEGKGDGECHLVGRSTEEWGEERLDELGFFEQDRLAECLDVSLDRVTKTLKAAETKLRATRRALVQVVPEAGQTLGMVVKSEAMRQVMDLTQRVAKVDTTVLITGPSGSGKERIARLLHQASIRADGPFVAINCGAITETLVESELFGHARGAFTGAARDRPGLFEEANSGTLLLDEVGELSPAMQIKLLRVLQEREVRRVGENKSRKVDVRVVAATNRDLGTGVLGGEFRKDLYYRLRVVELKVPALRHRSDDILPLARLLLSEAAQRLSRDVSAMSPGVADQLLRHEWPGNVRELQNAMEHAVALARGSRVEVEDLPEEIRLAPPISAPSLRSVQPLQQVEKEYILGALQLNGGNQSRTAKQLGVGSATLYRKLKSYGLIRGRQGTSPAEPDGAIAVP
jgi:two-component system, NtrC family, response regulator HydG